MVLGLTMAIKSAGLPLLLVLVLRRRWAAVLAGIVSALALALLTALYAESATWRTYAAYVPAFVQQPTIAVTANQSLVGWTRRFLDTGPLLSQLFLILISLATAWRLRSAPLPTAIAGGVLVSALFSPTAEDHHFAVLAIPVLLLDQQPRRAWVLLAVLLVIPLQWTAFAFTEGWSALLAYPRLYGTVLALMITVALQPLRGASLRNGDGRLHPPGFPSERPGLTDDRRTLSHRGCKFCLAPVRAACRC